VHGLCTHDGSPCSPIEIPSASRHEVRFAAGRAGTYHYWATTTAMPLSFRGASDTQLSGAFIVDPPDAMPDSDRVLVITEWTSLTRAELQKLASADDPGAAFRTLN
jgi:FtsP/CotA-like multicopper oxidase with cupredoxin domain